MGFYYSYFCYDDYYCYCYWNETMMCENKANVSVGMREREREQPKEKTDIKRKKRHRAIEVAHTQQQKII